MGAAHAQVFELDNLFPQPIPGYGTPFAVTTRNRIGKNVNITGWQVDGFQVSPDVAGAIGFDSAPNGTAPGSFLMRAAPAVTVADDLLGFGAYAGVTAAGYPQNAAQNTLGAVVALGETAMLPAGTITIAAAHVTTQETGFALSPDLPARPSAITVDNLRAGGKLTLGLLVLQPEVFLTHDSFSALPAEDRTDAREMLTTSLESGGPLTLVVRAGALQTRFGDGMFNAVTNELLTGGQYAATGIWNAQLLAGVAERRPALGQTVVAPVLEAALDWLPDPMNQIRLKTAREIDDPDDISLVPYTLTRAAISLRHNDLNSLVMHFGAEVSDAAYISSPLHETLLDTDAGLDWHFAPSFALSLDYAFNDRQANMLRAINEHLVTIGLTWTP